MHLLWIKTELLHPVDKGGRIRTYNMLRELRREHRVTYLTLDDGDAAADALARAGEYSTDVVRVPFRTSRKRSAAFYGELVANVFSPLPYAVSRWRSAAMRSEVARLARQGGLDAVVCDFLAPAVNVPHDLPVPAILFQHNVEAMIWRRHADVATNPVSRAYFRDQWRRMRRFEASECRRFDHVVAVSEADLAVFRNEYGVDGVSSIPTGVDIEYFRPTGAAIERPSELVFTGSMDWLPNEDGITWFVDSILPLIRAEVPDVTLSIVGRNPSPRVAALHGRDGIVTVTGSVPDVRPYMEQAAVFIIPLRIGGGTRLKVYEAMAMESPIVSTTIGAEGLPVHHGEDIVLADGAEAFAASTIALLRDRERARRFALTAAAFVRREFSWQRVAADFAEICAAAAPLRHPSTSIST